MRDLIQRALLALTAVLNEYLIRFFTNAKVDSWQEKSSFGTSSASPIPLIMVVLADTLSSNQHEGLLAAHLSFVKHTLTTWLLQFDLISTFVLSLDTVLVPSIFGNNVLQRLWIMGDLLYREEIIIGDVALCTKTALVMFVGVGVFGTEQALVIDFHLMTGTDTLITLKNKPSGADTGDPVIALHQVVRTLLTRLCMIIEDLVLFTETVVLVSVGLRVTGADHTLPLFHYLMILAKALLLDRNKVGRALAYIIVQFSMRRTRNAVVGILRKDLIVGADALCLSGVWERIAWAVHAYTVFFYLVRLAGTKTTYERITVYTLTVISRSVHLLVAAASDTRAAVIIAVSGALTARLICGRLFTSSTLSTGSTIIILILIAL